VSRVLLLAVPLALLAACVTTTVGEGAVDNKAASQANVELGVAYMREGKLQVAKEKLDRAKKQNPKSPDVYWAMASLHEAMNQPKQAESNYKKALELSPGNSQIENTYAVFLCRQGEVDRALPIFEKVIADKLYPTPYAAATNAGVCLRGQKRDADAERYFERAVAMGPSFVDAVVSLADLQLDQGKPEAARATAENFIRGGNKSAQVLLVAVRATVAQHDCNAAELYARLLRRDFQNSAQVNSLPQQLGVCAGALN
jgi:type IV pilus assembly protein PilF